MKEANNTFIPTIIFFTIVVLSIAQLLISNKLTTDSIELSQVEREINVYREKNILLEEQIVKNMSLTKIATSAVELGLVKTNGIFPISSGSRIAKLP